MPEKIKLCSGAKAVKKFRRFGWTIARHKGAHVMLVKEGYFYTLSVPQHSELGPGILKKLIKQAGITQQEFNKL